MPQANLQSGDRFETVQIPADPDNQFEIISKMPKAEFYSEEIARLVDLALNGSKVHDLGYLGDLHAAATCRERMIPPGNRDTEPYTHQIVAYRDAGDDQLLRVRYTSMLPLTLDTSGQKVQPTEIRWYTPSTGAMDIVRLDKLNPNDMANIARLRQMIRIEGALSPIQPTPQDHLLLYLGLVTAAGERVPE